MDNYFNYFTEVEEHFIRKRGKNLLVPPLDWCLIEIWRDNGIPIHVVIRGIDRSFDVAQRSQKAVPRSLSYCHPAVVEAFEEHQRATVGSQDEVRASNSIAKNAVHRKVLVEHIDNLLVALKSRKYFFHTSFNLLSSLKREVIETDCLDEQQIDRDLNNIGCVVAKVLQDDLSEKQILKIHDEVKKDLKIYKKHLAPEMYRRMETNSFNRILRREGNIPEFGLLEIATL